MSGVIEAIRTYDYLVMARARVMAPMRGLSAAQYQAEFPFGLKTLAATMAHVVSSEWYYVERIRGVEVPAYERWTIQYERPPVFEVIDRAWADQAERTREAIRAEKDWSRTIRWLSFPDSAGKRWMITTSAGDLFTQLVLHEVHHRAQAMAMLRQLGTPVEDVDFNEFMYVREGTGH